MITGRHDIDPVPEKRFANLPSHTVAGSGIFHVGNDQVRTKVIDEATDAVADKIATGPTDDVTNEKNAERSGIHRDAPGTRRSTAMVI
jgi:hypothetical protein